jgi:hypothetical protein
MLLLRSEGRNNSRAHIAPIKVSPLTDCQNQEFKVLKALEISRESEVEAARLRGRHQVASQAGPVDAEVGLLCNLAVDNVAVIQRFARRLGNRMKAVFRGEYGRLPPAKELLVFCSKCCSFDILPG